MNDETLVLIWSNEHQGWWRPQQCGYTSHKDLAGEYTLKEAVEICKNASAHIKWSHYPNEKTPVPNETIFPIYD